MKKLGQPMTEFLPGENISDALEGISKDFYLVYLIINNINNKKYVGITSVNRYHRRMKEHIWQSSNKCGIRYNYPLYKAFRKYGIESFTVYILDVYETVDEVKESERMYINKLNSYTGNANSQGYNQTLGGDGLFGVSGERHPMYGKRGSLSPNFGRKASDETRAKISMASKASLNHYKFKPGKEHPNYGKPVSEEMKQRLREANLGKVIPLYVREKISNTLKGRPGIPHSEETKKKLSEIASNRIGELAPNYGKKFSDDHKQKLSAAKKGKYVGVLNPSYGKKGNEAARSIAIVQLTLNGEYIKTHDSMGLATEETGISSSAISKVCRGVRNHTGGYKWAKLLDYEEHLNTGTELNLVIKKNLPPKRTISKNIVYSPKTTRVIQLSMDGKYIDTYVSLSEAQDKTGVNSTNISKCINKVQKSAGNYRWIKEDEYNVYNKELISNSK